MRPSWGWRRSAMSRSAMILKRLVSAGITLAGRVSKAFCSTPSSRRRARCTAVFLRFDMDVAGLAAEGLHQDAIRQLDHRRGIAIVDALHQVVAHPVAAAAQSFPCSRRVRSVPPLLLGLSLLSGWLGFPTLIQGRASQQHGRTARVAPMTAQTDANTSSARGRGAAWRISNATHG